ncbi:MAG: hypothetical protein NTX92_07600 [Euryarchaeota archaeon]|nr:hypothetical protein [Euryarchaeota archaeon]
MTKRFKNIKASILTGIILISAIIAVSPTISAGILFNLQSSLTVSWNASETTQPLVPRGGTRTLAIDITHIVNKGLLGAAVLQLYTGKQVTIKIEILETPSWATASLSQGTVTATINPGTVQTLQTYLTIAVAENAPAFGVGAVRLRATALKAGLVQSFEQDFTLNFQPDYKPLISPAFPDSNTKQIGPMDTATFRIDVTNMGNARTKVYLSVVTVPEGWVAIVTDQITLEEGVGSVGTAYLVVKPPKGFGYHYDEETIVVSMQPVKADEETKKGSITPASFLVESRGFSTPGFDAIAFIGALALVMGIIVFIRKRKQ